MKIYNDLLRDSRLRFHTMILLLLNILKGYTQGFIKEDTVYLYSRGLLILNIIKGIARNSNKKPRADITPG